MPSTFAHEVPSTRVPGHGSPENPAAENPAAENPAAENRAIHPIRRRRLPTADTSPHCAIQRNENGATTTTWVSGSELNAVVRPRLLRLMNPTGMNRTAAWQFRVGGAGDGSNSGFTDRLRYDFPASDATVLAPSARGPTQRPHEHSHEFYAGHRHIA